MKHTFLLLIIFNSGVFAQSENKLNNNLYLLSGIQYIGANNLNSVLKNDALPLISNWQYYMGIGGNDELGKWIIGGEGYLMFSDEEQNSTRLQLLGGMGYFYAGYKLVNFEKLALLPKVGIGGAGLNIQLNQRSTSVQSLDDFLSDNHSNNLTNGNWISHFGIKGIVFISKTFDIQFDSGYNLGWGGTWKAENNNLSDSVEDKIGGFFFQVSSSFSF